MKKLWFIFSSYWKLNKEPLTSMFIYFLVCSCIIYTITILIAYIFFHNFSSWGVSIRPTMVLASAAMSIILGIFTIPSRYITELHRDKQ